MIYYYDFPVLFLDFTFYSQSTFGPVCIKTVIKKINE